MNSAIAIAQRDGPDSGISEIDQIADRDCLESYPFYAAAIGELEKRRGNIARAREHFERAILLTRSAEEARFLRRRVQSLAQ